MPCSRERAENRHQRSHRRGVARQLGEKDHEQDEEAHLQQKRRRGQGRKRGAEPGGEPGRLNRGGERQPTAEEQHHPPGKLRRRSPVEKTALGISRIARGDEEHRHRAGDGDHHVGKMREPGKLPEQDARCPGRGDDEEDGRHALLRRPHRPECGKRLGDDAVSALDLSGIEAEAPAHEHEPGDGHHQQDHRHAHRHPFDEGDLAARRLADEADDEGVGRGADDGAEPTDARRIGDAEIERDGEGVVVRVLAEHGGRDRERDRQHHQRRRRVRDPHRDESRGRHEAEEKRRRMVSGAGDDMKRDALLEPPALQRHGHHEAAEKEIDDRLGEGPRGFGRRRHARERQDDERQQRGHRHRDRLRRPPGGHPGAQRDDDPGRGRQPLGNREEIKERRQSGTDPEPDPLIARPRPRALMPLCADAALHVPSLDLLVAARLAA